MRSSSTSGGATAAAAGCPEELGAEEGTGDEPGGSTRQLARPLSSSTMLRTVSSLWRSRLAAAATSTSCCGAGATAGAEGHLAGSCLYQLLAISRQPQRPRCLPKPRAGPSRFLGIPFFA